MSAPKEILDLVERFEQQLDAYQSGQFNETQLRREFLDPFFKALGWDLDNTAGYAEACQAALTVAEPDGTPLPVAVAQGGSCSRPEDCLVGLTCRAPSSERATEFALFFGSVMYPFRQKGLM